MPKKCVSDIPVNKGVVGSYDAESDQIVPAEAHGDEHDVVHVLLVPFWRSERREQDKSNLEGERKIFLVGCATTNCLHG